jgi:hypothetical protein
VRRAVEAAPTRDARPGDDLLQRFLMTLANDDNGFPTLFAHSLRKDWGVAVLSGQSDGKRRYLFENGAERTLASGFDEMMQRIEKPNADQQLAFARLQGVLAGRAKTGADAGRAAGWSLAKQLAKFRETYAAGFSDPNWLRDVRGGGTGPRAAATRDAQERFEVKALDSLLSSQQGAEVWRQARAIMAASGLVPASQLSLKEPGAEPLRALATAIRELLHGNGSYDGRFDRFVAAFTAAFGAAPTWEMATALPALFQPLDHVCVDSAMFKKQVKECSPQRSVTARASSAGYATFLSVARLVANKLAEQGEVPRDLADVRDFIIFTLKPTPKAKAKAKPKPAPQPVEED